MFNKLLFITNLLLSVAYTKSQHQLDINKKSVAVFRPKYQDFRINNIKYREGINPIFAMNFRPGVYNVSENPILINPGWAIYGNNYFKNALIKSNWKIIDTIKFYLHKDSIVNIIASAYHPYFYNKDKSNKIEYIIYHNKDQLYINKYKSFDFISKNYFNKGPHLLTFMAKTNDIACLCPTIGTGFQSGHHFAMWINMIEKEQIRVPYKITLPIYHKVNNDINNDMFIVSSPYFFSNKN